MGSWVHGLIAKLLSPFRGQKFSENFAGVQWAYKLIGLLLDRFMG